MNNLCSSGGRITPLIVSHFRNDNLVKRLISSSSSSSINNNNNSNNNNNNNNSTININSNVGSSGCSLGTLKNMIINNNNHTNSNTSSSIRDNNGGGGGGGNIHKLTSSTMASPSNSSTYTSLPFNLSSLFGCNLSSRYKRYKSETIELTVEESHYFNLFNKVLSHFGRDDVVLRVSGGWVRNKLLGIESGTDIDIAVENMTGSQFVDLINNYLTQYQESKFKTYLVKMNPDKSKHLETSSIVFEDGRLTFDFTGLRKEEYDATSRIPTVEQGNLISDSHRRDITINTLYFNLKTNTVEDYTCRGLDDLENGIIRTPLPPLFTLMEDPLRALRVLRFANRFQFKIEPKLVEALKSQKIRDLLDIKVSRERIKTEFSSMMSTYQYAVDYYRDLVQSGLIDAVFPTQHLVSKDDWIQSLRYLEQSESLSSFLPAELIPDFILASIFLPLKLKYKEELDINQILLFGKFPKKQTSNVVYLTSSPALFESCIQKLVNQYHHSTALHFNNVVMRTELFDDCLYPMLKWLRGNDLWKSGIWLTCLHFKMLQSNPSLVSEFTTMSPKLQTEPFWHNLVGECIEKGLYDMSNQKNCLNGHMVKQALGITAKGVPLQPINDKLLEWQWKNHNNYTIDDAIKFVKVAYTSIETTTSSTSSSSSTTTTTTIININ